MHFVFVFISLIKKNLNVLQVASHFTGKLLGIVRDANLHLKGMNKSLNENPQVGNDIYTGDPALEFIKHVCAVMALDQNVQHDILVILFFPRS